jgi:cyclopropane fatty-acyl-phospholipid synthase-like methyltransferase
MPDQGSEGLLSPYLRNKRINAARSYIFGRVLDIGCGTGKLASLIPSDRYFGVDIDAESIDIAKRRFADHIFETEYPSEQEKFDTVIALAVIEHINDSKVFLQLLSMYLKDDPRSRIVVTSPHPFTESIHYFGSRVGLFSRAGNEEHENLYRKNDFDKLAKQCGLHMVKYKRFLLGLNQLVICQKGGSCL